MSNACHVEETIKIAFIDSGLGGVIFARDFYNSIKRLRQKNNHAIEFIHIYDNKNFPYGSKTPEEIIDIATNSLNIASKLEVDMVLVACNTISSFKQNLQIPQSIRDRTFFILEPSVEAIYNTARCVCLDKDEIDVLIVGTPTTIAKGTAQSLITTMHQKSGSSKKLNINTMAPTTWAPLVETATTDISCVAIAREFTNFLEQHNLFNRLQAVGLLCTHYPIAQNSIYNSLRQQRTIYPFGKNVLHIIPQGSLFASNISKNTLSKFVLNCVGACSVSLKFTFYATNIEAVNIHQIKHTVTSLYSNIKDIEAEFTRTVNKAIDSIEFYNAKDAGNL